MQISLVLQEDEIKIAVEDYIKKNGLAFGGLTPDITLTGKAGKVKAEFNIDTDMETVVAAVGSPKKKEEVVKPKTTNTVLSAPTEEPKVEERVEPEQEKEEVVEDKPTNVFKKTPDSPFKSPAGNTGIMEEEDSLTGDTLFTGEA